MNASVSPLPFGRLRRSLPGRLLALSLCSLALSFTTLTAQPTGTVVGVATDMAGLFLAGAEVRLQGTEHTTTTNRQGQYRLSGVSPGDYTLRVAYLGLDDFNATVTVPAGGTATQDAVLKSDLLVLDKYVVESVRLGQSRAINQQRASNTISNIISSDAIGNLPDNTIAEALSRLPGVSVEVNGGVASFASIRGSEAKLNSVTLDGQRITATPSESGLDASNSADTRAVDLSLIPSELVGSVELIKALAADKDADSFGGTINLVTRSAYDLKKRSFNGRFDLLHNDFGNRDGFAAAISYSDVLNKARTLGISASFNLRQQDSNQDDTEIAYYLATDSNVSALPAVGDEGIEEYDIRHRRQSRDTYGGSVNLDWKPSDRTDWHLRALYNNAQLDETRFRTRVRGLRRFASTSTAELASGAEARLTRRLEDVTRDQDITRLAFEGTSKFDAGTLSYGLTYGNSTFVGDRFRTSFEFGSSSVRRSFDWVVDRSNPVFPAVTVTHRATGENGFSRPQDMTLVQIRNQDSKESDTDWVGNLDYSLDQRLGERTITWKIGTKYRDKVRHSRPTLQDTANNGAALTEASFEKETGPVNVIRGTVPAMGDFASLDSVSAFVAANPTRFTRTTGSEDAQLNTKVYNANEDISAGYLMASTKFGALEAIAGVRYEATDVSYTWLTAPGGPLAGGNDYSNVFPSLIFNYRPNKHLVIRLAGTKTLARPDYADLVPFASAEDPESGDTEETPPSLIPVFRGNPNLGAQTSRNYDLSIEWYFDPSAVFSVSVFKKDVSNFIFRSQTIETVGTQNFVVLQQQNGATQNINGVEVSWQQAFTMLPSPFDGFGINANITFIDGSSKFRLIDPVTLQPTLRKENFVPNQADTVYNVQLYYEKYGFTARVAVNFTDSFVRDVGGIVGDVTNNSATRWDASLNYRLTEHLTLFVEGKNLSNEVKSWYNGRPARPEEWEYVGWTGIAGVKWRF